MTNISNMFANTIHNSDIMANIIKSMGHPDYAGYTVKMDAWRDDIRQAVENNELPMREFIVSKEFEIKNGQWASRAFPLLLTPWAAIVKYEFPNGYKAALVSGTQHSCGADTPWCLYLVGLSGPKNYLTDDAAVIELARIMALPPLHDPLKT